MSGALDDPVINSPYDEPREHFVIDDNGHPAGEKAKGRRPSQSFVPVAVERKGQGRKAVQEASDFGAGER